MTRICARCGRSGDDRTTKPGSSGELYYCLETAECKTRVENDVAVNGDKIVECAACGSPVKRRDTQTLHFEDEVTYFEALDSDRCKAVSEARTEANNVALRKRQEEWLAKERAERRKAILGWLITLAIVGWIVFSLASPTPESDYTPPSSPTVVVDVSDGEPDCAFGDQGVPIATDPNDLDRDDDGLACE